MKSYGIIKIPVATIWDGRSEIKENNLGETVSAISDEGLYGMGLSITGAEDRGFYPVRTFYGYSGFIRKEEMELVSLKELKCWEECGLMVTDGSYVDILSLPKVQGVRLLSLFRGSLIRVLSFESETEGWAKVELLDGRVGYMRNQFLRKKEFSQSGLWTRELPQKEIVDEASFRKSAVETAKQYLGTQYRWGGRSTAGIDCSGLTSESYLLNGILIYRDARIEPGFPVHEIPKDEMLPGDLMYFPGHIAMYMGNGAYIHSTGKIGSGGVVINSLNPQAEDYRADLAESWYASGSIFGTAPLMQTPC
ncbi:C40 family peptidase [Lacrimispora celerecrescens]|uniref:NlpC/P60 family protein n=1 Tax=[Clostridium] celerecrescens 18A TaxID=1286362 RepID=A0A2M8ZC40_9FIRM|nr:C40 family peptidase [Lacrimispora celerecrescens]PJJ31014.1 NlpC/P60 family protein [[Clostridium] celerecrescens 18A]